MGNALLEFMKGLGIFIICAQSFLHFTAGKSYEKYVKLLIGMMILAQFVVPVRALFLGHDRAQITQQVERFRTQMEGALKQADTEGFSCEEEDTVTQALQDEIKEKLEDTAKGFGYEVKAVRVGAGEEKASEVTVTVTEKEAKGNRIQIDRIKVGDPSSAQADSESAQEMRAAFSSCLGTQPDYVKIICE